MVGNWKVVIDNETEDGRGREMERVRESEGGGERER